MTQRDIRLLSEIPLFEGLSPAQLRELHAMGVRRRIEAGDVLFTEGAEARSLYVLLEGRVRVTRDGPTGQQVVLHFAHPGDVLGCAILAGNLRYPGSAQVLVAGVALAISDVAISALVERTPQLARNALRMLSGRMDELRVRLLELSTERVEQRLALALLRLARTAGTESATGTRLDLRLSRQDLAELVGTTQYTVSRLLSAWDQAAWVQVGRGWVIVQDRAALLRLSAAPGLPSAATA